MFREFEAVMQTRDEVDAFKNKRLPTDYNFIPVYVINTKSWKILDYLTQWLLRRVNKLLHTLVREVNCPYSRSKSTQEKFG